MDENDILDSFNEILMRETEKCMQGGVAQVNQLKRTAFLCLEGFFFLEGTTITYPI